MKLADINDVWGSFSEEEKAELQEETARMVEYNARLGRKSGTLISTMQHNNRFYKVVTDFATKRDSDDLDFGTHIKFFELSENEYKIITGTIYKHEESFRIEK